jgi:hypothetical protein
VDFEVLISIVGEVEGDFQAADFRVHAGLRADLALHRHAQNRIVGKQQDDDCYDRPAPPPR